jgi:hypothetical protein
LNFYGAGTPLDGDGMDRVCRVLRVGPPEVWAVLAVETEGFGFLADRRPRMLFERHVFRQLTRRRFDREYPDLSNRRRGGYAGGAREYVRLERAMALQHDAALESASWGIAQVMGFNHRAAGFHAADAMVAAMVDDENAQVAAMARFIRDEGLDEPLRDLDWASFARGYNGPAYKATNYDTRLAAAHERFTAALPDLSVRTAQAALVFLGFDPGPVDGIHGPRTRRALVEYQKARSLAISGELTADTTETLMREAFS